MLNLFKKGCFLVLLLGQVWAFEFPKNQGFVTDKADIFSAADAVKISDKLQTLQQQYGVEMAVLTLVTLNGETLQPFSTQVAENWGIGNGEKDNGLLLTIVVNDRQWRIDTGYGMEGLMPDLLVNRMGENTLVPAFREGRYAKGVLVLLDDIKALVAGDESVYAKYKKQEERNPVVNRMVIYVVAALGFLLRLFLYFQRNTIKEKVPYYLSGGVISALVGLVFIGLEGVFLALTVYFFFVILGNGNIGGSSGGYGARSGSGFGGFSGGSFGGGGSSGGW